MSLYNHKLPSTLIPQSDICVPLHIPAHPDYVALLVRALRVLTLDRHYERDENRSAKIVRRQWIERTLDPLIESLIDAGDCIDCESGDCEAYDNSASFITYSPQNPFSEPDLVPSGYLTPPFTRFAEFPIVGWLSQWLPNFTEELTGYMPNDVIVDISSMPSGSWSEPALGMPQIAIDVSGNGVVELHMLNFPLGGRAIVTIDSQPNIGDILGGIIGNSEFIIELNRDLLSVPPENVVEVIYEVQIDDEIPTSHTIYITFAPTVDDALVPINFGGGIRSIVLCGLDSQIMPIVEDIRLNNCQIEKLINGQWIAAGDVNQCVTDVTNPMQAQINTNASNIANNQSAITINTNKNAEQDNRLDVVEANLSQNNGIISDHEQRIVVLENVDAGNRLDVVEANLSQNNGIVSDHEQRIVVLENSGGGGGGQNVLFTAQTVQVDNQLVNSLVDTWETAVPFNHQFTYTNALIIVELRCYTYPAARRLKFRLSVNQSASPLESWTTDGGFQSIQCNGVFSSIDTTQPVYCELQFQANSAGGGRIPAWQQVNIAIWEFSDVSLPQSDIVTFEANSASYILLPSQVGTIQNTGYPDNALDGLPALNEFIGIEIDNGGQDITDIVLDMYLENKNPFRLQITVDGILEYDQPLDFVGQSMVWFTHRVSDYSNIFPIVGATDVEIKILNYTSGATSARMDNVKIEV